MDADATLPLPAAKKPKPKILLVEDEANIASMVQDWLSEKYDVSVASTGKMALEKAAAEQPALILEDINLPDMVGYDVVKVLEKDSKTAHIPVIFLTGEKMVDETVKFIATVKNVKGYVNKPFRLKDFLEKIELILGHKSEFVVLERKASTAESQEKAEVVRAARAADRAGEEPRPAVPVPPARSAAAARPHRERGFLGGLLVFLVWVGFWSVFLGALLGVTGETVLRLAAPFTGGWVFSPPLVPSGAPGIPPVLPPSAAWEQDGVMYRTNSLALRDGEVDVSTLAFRAALLGGTSVFGAGVPWGEVVAKRVESQLRRAPIFPSTNPAVVVNAALWGMPPDRQWAAYERLHPILRPRVVIWAAGDPGVLPAAEDRLERMSRLPPELRPWLDQSRLAGLAQMLYLHRGAVRPAGLPTDLGARLGRFMDAHPDTAVMVLLLERGAKIPGLAPREKLLVFNLASLVEGDAGPRGLSSRGHQALAKTTLSLLAKYKDRILGLPPAPPPPVKTRRR
jgi:CheY-like chemotaxis protein